MRKTIGSSWPGRTGLSALLVFVLCLVVVLAPSPGSSDSDRPNVVLVVVDALRPDHLGCYGYDRPTSPHIDELAAGGIRFQTAITQAPWTKGSFASILTSLYPFQHGVTDWNSVMPETLVTLPEVLRQHGYSTMCVINMIGLADRFGVLKGFAVVSEEGFNERNAKVTTDTALDLISSAPEPFFLVVHYFDTHEPYRPPIAYLDMVRRDSDIDPLNVSIGARKDDSGRPTEGFIQREMLFYDGCVRYVDESIGRLARELEERGLRDETVLIITADHGEAFWEHGIGSHGANVYDEAIKVPLILTYPGRYAGPQAIDVQVSHVDLFPTILEIAGIPADIPIEGTGLVELIEEGRRSRRSGRFLPASATLCECTVRRAPGTKCIRTDEVKVIIEPATSLIEAYDLCLDPGETTNIWDHGIDQAKSMLLRLKEIPGVNLRGWRLAFTGERDQTAYAAQVRLGEGGRLAGVERFTRRQTLSIEAAQDSTWLRIEATPRGLDFVLFDVVPEDKALELEIAAQGEAVPDSIAIGASRTAPMGLTVTVTTSDAFGLPGAFSESRESGAPGVYLWWLSGDEIGQPKKAIMLTPEEKKRLKALGYIQ